MDMGKEGGVVSRQLRDAGLTLIEVTFALLILAGSFVVILSLQSAAVQRELTDRDKQNAMLLGRRILAAIETQKAPLEVGVREEKATELLRSLMEQDPPDIERDSNETKDLEARLTVEDWGIPGSDEKPLHRVTLYLYSPSFPREGFEVNYFVPKAEGEGDEDAEE